MHINVHDEPLSPNEMAELDATAVGQRFVIVKAANRFWFANGRWQSRLMLKLGGPREPPTT